MDFNLSARQTEAWDLLTNDRNEDVLYGGAKGGGKSWFLCVWAFYWSNWLIDYLDLVEPQKYPIPVGFLGRLQSVDFRTTTLETWKSKIPSAMYEIRHQDREIVIRERVKLMFGGLDKTESVAKFNSAELAFFAIDQAEEVEREDIAVLEGSLRLRNPKKGPPPYKTLYTANPRSGWLKSDFVKGGRSGARFVKALPRDNPYLPGNYEDQLRKAFGHNTVLLRAYLEGDWDVFLGAFFEKFNRKTVVFNPLHVEIQPTWQRFLSVDWGYTAPMAVYWHALAPDGHVYTYREWYKTGYLDVDASKEVKSIIDKNNEKIVFAVGDPQSFPVKIAHYRYGRTESVKRAEVWAENGISLVMGDSDRVLGWTRMLQYMEARELPSGELVSFWHISSSCTNLLDEITSAQRDKNNVEDISSDSVDHGLESCFVKGTLISTSEGDKPIEDIKSGDFVLTRNGFKAVNKAGCTGVDDVFEIGFSNGEKLVGTRNHPLFCNNKWTSLVSCGIGDKCQTFQTTTEKQEVYGEEILVKSQKGFIYTIGTIIRKTMSFPILFVHQLMNIYHTMVRTAYRLKLRSTYFILRKLDLLLRLLIKVKKAEGKDRYQKKNDGNQESIERFPVLNVEENSIQKELTQNSVIQPVKDVETQKKILSQKHARSVQDSFLNINSHHQVPVLKDVVVTSAPRLIGKEKVYNIEVSESPEYFANKILVHNCRLFLMTQKPKFIQRIEKISMLEAAERQRKRIKEETGEDY